MTDPETAPRSPLAGELRRATAADDADALRLLPGLHTAMDTAAAAGAQRARRRRRWQGLGLAAGLAAAAGVAAVLSVPPPPPQPLSMELAESGPGRTVALLDGVTLQVAGAGRVGGTTRHPVLDWSAGALMVDVRPGAVDGLEVSTAEGAVRITGTAFSVERSALGTTVSVARGAVEVVCTDGPVQSLAPTDTTTCLPTSAGGLLGRAHALEDAGAPPGVVAETLAAAAALGPTGGLAQEICLSRALALRSAGRSPAARTVAEACLRTPGGARRQQLLLLVVELAIDSGSCAGLDPVIGELGSLGPAVAARCAGLTPP